MGQNANYWIEHLQLKAHPEGGYYREMYRSDESIPKEALPNRYSNSRSYSTAIYFLLESKDISAFHRITSDELWFFHAGTSVEVFVIKDNELQVITLGSDSEKGEVFQATIPKNCWFGAKVKSPDSYVLVSCTVAPGFDFDDFELAKRDELLKEFPSHTAIIKMLTR